MLILGFVESQLKSFQNLSTSDRSKNKCNKVSGSFKQNTHLLLSTNLKAES